MSNFAPHPFQMVAESGQISEHYFHTKVFGVPQIQEKIVRIASPMDAALEGRNRQIP